MSNQFIRGPDTGRDADDVWLSDEESGDWLGNSNRFNFGLTPDEDRPAASVLPRSRPPPTGRVRVQKDREMRESMQKSMKYFQEHHADLLARHPEDCLCADCTSDHDEFDPIVRRDSNVLLSVGPPPNLQALEPQFGSSIRSAPATSENYPLEADDMPSTTRVNPGRTPLADRSMPCISRRSSSPATQPTTMQMIQAFIKSADKPLSHCEHTAEAKIIKCVTGYVNGFHQDKDQAAKLAKQALGAGNLSLRIESDDYQFPPSIQKREQGNDDEIIFLRPVLIDACAVMKQYDSKYDMKWKVKTQDATAREAKCLKMQAFKDLLLLFILRGHKTELLVPEYYRRIIEVNEAFNKRGELTVLQELENLTDDMSLFVNLYETGVICFLETNRNYRTGNPTTCLQTWMTVVRERTVQLNACLVSSFYYDRHIANRNLDLLQQGYVFEKSSDHSQGLQEFEFKQANKRFLTPIFVSKKKILVMPLTFHSKVAFTQFRGHKTGRNNKFKGPRTKYQSVMGPIMLRYDMKENDKISRHDYEILVLENQLTIEKQKELAMLLAASYLQMPQLMLRCTQTLLLLMTYLELLPKNPDYWPEFLDS
ncbi:hypothetical protein WR25_22636 [Diploscapter pachys]|uniref:Uncharacterized protein n=1 Tax=Diploscapter pachys TaxID=2018661 RepID=A0A2A2L752_9BILA|nr:hypothetical protein WR25_22636 [Diploscapter pachys]